MCCVHSIYIRVPIYTHIFICCFAHGIRKKSEAEKMCHSTTKCDRNDLRCYFFPSCLVFLITEFFIMSARIKQVLFSPFKWNRWWQKHRQRCSRIHIWNSSLHFSHARQAEKSAIRWYANKLNAEICGGRQLMPIWMRGNWQSVLLFGERCASPSVYEYNVQNWIYMLGKWANVLCHFSTQNERNKCIDTNLRFKLFVLHTRLVRRIVLILAISFVICNTNVLCLGGSDWRWRKMCRRHQRFCVTGMNDDVNNLPATQNAKSNASIANHVVIMRTSPISNSNLNVICRMLSNPLAMLLHPTITLISGLSIFI